MATTLEESQMKLPGVCNTCDYLNTHQLTSNRAKLFFCGHKESFDKTGQPLFVMPAEAPPEECPLRSAIIKSVLEGEIK